MTIAAIVLAAGQGTRFRAADVSVDSKLVVDLGGTPLVRIVVEAALASMAARVIVVTGHAGEAVEAALLGLDVRFVHNLDYRSGLAGSLRCGIAALPPGTTAVVVLLGDMPLVNAELLDRLMAEAEARPEADAVVPVHAGSRGNPVLLSARLFDAVRELTGDAGAARLLRDPALVVRELATDRVAVTFDVDHPDDLAALRHGVKMVNEP